MNDLPRHTLSRIMAKHGPGICDSPKRLEAMLRDLCGAHRREINIIMGALEERVATDFTSAGKSVPRDALFARLEARLRDNLAYTPEAARWGVETWAVALGILSEAKLKERTGKQSSAASQSNAPPPVQDAKSSGEYPARTGPQTPEPQRGPTHRPPHPPSVRPSAAAQRRMPSLPPTLNAPEPPQHDISLSPPPRGASRRGLTMRSCLTILVLVIVLIIAAVFVVPAIIMILREEQATPSINEPRSR